MPNLLRAHERLISHRCDHPVTFIEGTLNHFLELSRTADSITIYGTRVYSLCVLDW